MTKPIACYSPTGIRVVIVGAGFGGLTAAIECHLKGHKVTVLERAPEWRNLGDILSISPNAGRILSRWSDGHIANKLKPICINTDHLSLYTHKGEFILKQNFPAEPGWPSYNGHRAELHKVFYDYAVELGIPILMGQRVISYNDDKQGAWVELESGQIIKGDIVVASDGLRSRAKKAILQSHNLSIGTGKDRGAEGMWKERGTGYSVYRAWFDCAEAGVGRDPLTMFFTQRDTHRGWLGKDVHFLVASLQCGRKMSWVATHPTLRDVGEEEQDGEDWMNPVPAEVEEVVELFESWDPVAKAIVKKTPPGNLIDFPIITHTPLPTFISKNGHILLLGDAAHPFLPTAIQGASQAMEDGIVLATYLSLSHFSPDHGTRSTPEKTAIAVKAWQKIRYERVKAAQKTGETVMQTWHKKDGKSVNGDGLAEKEEEKPKNMELPREEWLLGHDAEVWAREVWEEIREEVCGGKKVGRERLAAGPESDEVRGMTWRKD